MGKTIIEQLEDLKNKGQSKIDSPISEGENIYNEDLALYDISNFFYKETHEYDVTILKKPFYKIQFDLGLIKIKTVFLFFVFIFLLFNLLSFFPSFKIIITFFYNWLLKISSFEELFIFFILACLVIQSFILRFEILKTILIFNSLTIKIDNRNILLIDDLFFIPLKRVEFPIDYIKSIKHLYNETTGITSIIIDIYSETHSLFEGLKSEIEAEALSKYIKNQIECRTNNNL